MPASASLGSHNVIGGDVKQAKFDRQLRLWGADGQAALEAAHVVALGATPAIAEALKSLVLTGVRTVTLVDERTASAAEAAANYFVSTLSCDNAPLATAVLKNICPLGEQCVGVAATLTPMAWVDGYVTAVEQDWQAGRLHKNEFLSLESTTAADAASRRPSSASSSPSPCGTGASSERFKEKAAEDVSALRKFLRACSAVVSADSDTPASPSAASASESSKPSPHIKVAAPSLILVSERYPDLSSASPLVQTCLRRCYPDVPVVLVRSSGFLGFVQVHCPSRVILRPHNPTQVKMEDLRIFEPFPKLRAWFDAHNPDDDAQFSAKDVDAMSLHSHLPYPCILHHAFRRWWSSLSLEEQTKRQHPQQPQPPHQKECTVNSSSPSPPSSLSAPVTREPTPAVFPLSLKDYRDIAGVVAGMIRRQSPPEDAFIEAMEKCTGKLNRPVVQRLPEGLQALLQDPRCTDPFRAVTELKARLFAESQEPALFAAAHARCAPGAAPLHASALLLWTRQEVLIWYILHAICLFVTGKIGREDSSDGCRCTTAGVTDGEKHQTAEPRESQASSNARVSLSGGEQLCDGTAGNSPSQHAVSSYHMPFFGYLPDFTTTTMWYRELQDIYHEKHLEDVACIAEKAWEVLLHSVTSAINAAARTNRANCADTQNNDAVDVAQLEQQLRPLVWPLLVKHTTTAVENIWDLRMVSFSAPYVATQETEWRLRLGRRLLWLTENISYDVQWNADARRSACLAVAQLCKEELRRCIVACNDCDNHEEHRDCCDSVNSRDNSSAHNRNHNDHPAAQRCITGQAIAREAMQLAALGKSITSPLPQPQPQQSDSSSGDAPLTSGDFAKWFVEDDGPRKLFPRACEEVARWGGASDGSCVQQLPSVAASTGALAAQEAVKLIMRIRIPCSQPLMYDGYTNKVFTL